MRIIFPVFFSLAAVLALTSSNASSVSDSAWKPVDDETVEEDPGAQLFPIKELWRSLPLEMADELQEFRASIDLEFRAALVPTGEAEADWKTRGIDLTGYLATLPGGLDANALLTVGEVPMIRFFGKIPADILTDWKYIHAGPKAVGPGEAIGGAFLALSPNHIVFVADDERQTGNARCMNAAVERAADHATVYRYAGVPFDPDSDASLEAEAEAIVLHNLIGGLGSPVFCWTVHLDQDGQYRHLSYTPDGRPLGNMDEPNDHLEFISPVDLYELLNANFNAEFANDDPSNPAESVTDPS